MLIHIPIYCWYAATDDTMRYLVELELACLDSYFAHGNTHDVLATTNDLRVFEILSAYRTATRHPFELRLISRDETRRAFDIDERPLGNEACVKMMLSKFYPIVQRLNERLVHVDVDTLFLKKVDFEPLFARDTTSCADVGLIDDQYSDSYGWYPNPEEADFFDIDGRRARPVRRWINSGVFSVQGGGFDLCRDGVANYFSQLERAIATRILDNADEILMNALAVRDPDRVRVISDATYNFLAYELKHDTAWRTNANIVHFHSTKPHVFEWVEGRVQHRCPPERQHHLNADLYRAALLWCSHLHSACRGLGDDFHDFHTLRAMPLQVVESEHRRLSVGRAEDVPPAAEGVAQADPGMDSATLPLDPTGLLRLAGAQWRKGLTEEAEETYERRIAMGGWSEEVWRALYELGLLRLQAGHPWTEVEATMLRAYAYRPTRAEPLWVLAVSAREAGRHDKALEFARQAVDVPEPTGDVIDVRKDVYEWRVREEVALALWALGKLDDAFDLLTSLVASGTLPDAELMRLQLNRTRLNEQMRQAHGAQSSHVCTEAVSYGS